MEFPLGPTLPQPDAGEILIEGLGIFLLSACVLWWGVLILGCILGAIKDIKDEGEEEL